MPVSIGDKLGPYEILAPIGAGGMGEVYKARDSKLEREVAIKVLPAALARDPERLARFEREAKVLASLNHPNIAQIYGIEESDSGRALVMELVPGHTLAGPFPLNEALRIAGQITDALEAAHDKSIVHRDLKPANIMITPQGAVKVLDFGLAAVTPPSAAAGGDPNNSPTLTMGATQAGMILGTAGYMSPEQAAGQSVDKRADIWSFGAVFWEMLTGQRLFTGNSTAHILADVLRAPIDFQKLPATTPRAVRDLLKRCLDRNVNTRLRDIGEARIAIQNLGNESEASAEAAPSGHPSRWIWTPWGVAALAIVGAAGLSLVHSREQPAQQRSLRFEIPLPEKMPDTIQRISPDGRYLVFSDYEVGGPLWVRPLNSPAAQRLAGTEGADYPFWSPDSKSIGFFADGKLKRIEVTGGPALALADAAGGRGGTWSSADGSGANNIGVILFTPTLNSPILRISAGGGTVSPVTKLRTGENLPSPALVLARWPAFSLFGDTRCLSNHNTIHLGDLSSPEDRVIGEADSEAVFSQGFLLFLRQETLMAQPFDARRRNCYRRRRSSGATDPAAADNLLRRFFCFHQRIAGISQLFRRGNCS